MKILYLTKGDHVDYQNDCLLIGLKELFGSSVVDFNKQEHNYDTYDEHKAKTLYGMGMSVTKVLPDLEVDRTDITNKIKNKFFDYIVYGSIWRCSDYLDKILQYYPKNQVIAVDGEDESTIHSSFNLGILYFKRELHFARNRMFPISFAMPTSKGIFNKNKSKPFSFITPLNRQTYIYKDEQSYYKDYQQSMFGTTLKKAGWDCMRHYEILSNGCIPFFIDIEKCPEHIMTHFPKNLCKEVNNSFKHLTADQIYDKFINQFESHFKQHNTTKALAKYFIDTIKP